MRLIVFVLGVAYLRHIGAVDVPVWYALAILVYVIILDLAEASR